MPHNIACDWILIAPYSFWMINTSVYMVCCIPYIEFQKALLSFDFFSIWSSLHNLNYFEPLLQL